MTSTDVSQPQLAHHDSRLLDLAFAMDTTGSMSAYITSACNNIRRIVEEIVAKECSDLRLALVEYRDHPPQDSTYVTQVHDFTPSVSTMKGWLQNSSAQGGGDAPEAVADALHDVLKLSWRPEATKICVLVSDAPPHGLSNMGDSFPNGCPAGHDPMDIVRNLAEKGVTLYVAGCEPSLSPYKDFFAALAYLTGGQYVPLSAAGALTAVIVGGAQEEMSLEQWMEQVNQLVMQEVEQQGAQNVSHEHLSHQVMGRLQAAGARGKQLQMNKAALQPASTTAINLSSCVNMAAMRSEWKDHDPPQSPLFAGAPPAGAFGATSPALRSAPTRASGASVKAAKRSRATPAGALLASPMGGAPMSELSATDTYDTAEGGIQMSQAHRMVQKSLMRNKISLSKK